jgi:hypothetical protein
MRLEICLAPLADERETALIRRLVGTLRAAAVLLLDRRRVERAFSLERLSKLDPAAPSEAMPAIASVE